MDGQRYQISGNIDFPGYLLVPRSPAANFCLSNTTRKSIVFEGKGRIRRWHRLRIPDPKWFQTPLKSASITFPEFMDIPGTAL